MPAEAHPSDRGSGRWPFVEQTGDLRDDAEGDSPGTLMAVERRTHGKASSMDLRSCLIDHYGHSSSEIDSHGEWPVSGQRVSLFIDEVRPDHPQVFSCRVFSVAKVPSDTVARRRPSSALFKGEDSDGSLEVVRDLVEPVH